ncbi:hypothetical protein H4R34_004883 [Dimargaris verticillata]|uniref:Centromere protein M n=1 Tax=Dimargaris verticillata TaxID=2761393 RepID=A0A9W8AXH2_9FUNG|nr:hypothetical protein H4R34_004883 [Dimargaris verticillata]
MTPAPHPKAGFGLFPTPASPTAPWQLLLIGAQGSGKQSLAKQLAQIIPRTDQLVIHTTSELPISQSPSVQPKPPLHVDYAVLVVNLTDSQALANLETYMDLAPPEYFIGRLCIVATFFDRKMEHAFDLVELEAVIENICDIPIFYLNAKK